MELNKIVIHEETKNNNDSDEDSNNNCNSQSEKVIQEIKKIYWEQMVNDIKDNFIWRDRWMRITRYSETIATILLLSSGLCASLQLVYTDVKYFSVAVIIVNSIIFSLNKLATSGKDNNSRLNTVVNDYLKSIKIDRVIPNNI